MQLTRAIEYFTEWSQQKYTSRTVQIYIGHLRRFADFVGDKPVEEIDLFNDVITYARHLERKGWKDNTVNLAMISLRMMWRALYNLERQLNIRLLFMADMIPVKNLVVAQSHRPISTEEFDRLMEAVRSKTPIQPLMRARDMAIFSLLYDTGLRISELTALNVSSLDMPRRSLEVVTRKRRDHLKKRESHWTLNTHFLLMHYIERKSEVTNSDVLFINFPNYDRLTQRSIQRQLKGYLRLAKLDPAGITPHSFRHSVGKRAAAAQMYPPHLQDLLGHRNPNSSKVYYNITNEDLRLAYHTKLGDMRTDKVMAALSEKRRIRRKANP